MNDMSHNFTTETFEVIHANVLAVMPELAEHSQQIDKDGVIPPEILEKLEKAGAFRALVPKQFGGPGLSEAEVCALIEEVAYVDASTAWNMMVTSGATCIMGRLPMKTLNTIYDKGPNTFCKGAVAPKCVAKPVEGGYMVTGQWPLASGQRDYDWVKVGFMVKDENGIRMDPEVPGRPDLKFGVVPADQVEIINTWDSVGVRASGSDDVKVTDLFIADDWTASLFGPSQVDHPVLGMRMPFATGPHQQSVVMGILRAAIDHLKVEAQTRKPAFNPKCVMKDEPVFQNKFGEIIIRYEGLRLMYHDAIKLVTMVGLEGGEVTGAQAGKLAATSTFVHHEGADLMNQLMALSGSGGLYLSNPQQRRWRDLRCAAAHQSANIGHFAMLARAVLAEAGGDGAGAVYSTG